LLGWRNIFVLAVKVVLSAELARPGFIALLFSRSAVIASLRGSDLLSSYLLCCTVVVHIRRGRVWSHWLGVLLCRRWRLRVVCRWSIGVRRAHGMAITIRHVAIWPVLRVHGRPRRMMATMLHGGLRLRLGLGGLDVGSNAETSRAGAVRLWGGCGLGRRWRTVG
jgi:hypothetical protein